MATSIQTALGSLSRSLESYLYLITEEGALSGQTISPALDSESTTQIPDILIFQFPIADIFDDVKLLSATLAKYAIDDKKGDMFDKITVTEEDRPIFERFCKSAAMYAYTKMQGLAKTITPAFLYDEGVTIGDHVPGTLYAEGSFVRTNGTIYKALVGDATDPEGVIDPLNVNSWEEMPDYLDTTGKVSILIVNKTTYDQNILKVWSDNLKDMMTNYILEKIFKFRTLGQELAGIVMTERVTKEQELISTISSRKNPVKRFVSWP
jgi:hypothetical protein